jgi:hypothetical protein
MELPHVGRAPHVVGHRVRRHRAGPGRGTTNRKRLRCRSRLRPDAWAEIPVSVINQGYVTGPLQLRSSAVPGVEVDAPDTELTGASSQQTRFRVRLAEPGAADLTLRFWAIGSLGGLANKNTAYLYLRCLADDADPSREDVRGAATR